MRRELGIARCGLACCLCTENADCNGCDSNSCPDNDFCENKKCSIAKELTHCYKCEETCKKGLLSSIILSCKFLRTYNNALAPLQSNIFYSRKNHYLGNCSSHIHYNQHFLCISNMQDHIWQFLILFSFGHLLQLLIFYFILN